MLFDTYGMEVDLMSIFKKLIKPEDNIEFLPAYDRFIEKADVTVPGDAGGERDEQETQEIY